MALPQWLPQQHSPPFLLDYPLGQTLLIFGTQRCGSTMVCRDFASTGVLGQPSEYFNRFLVKYRRAKFQLDADTIRQDLQACLAAGQKSEVITAYKIMSNQLSDLGRALVRPQVQLPVYPWSWGAGATKKAYQDAVIRFFRQNSTSLKFIRVYRRDKLKQAISRLIARRTLVYHQHQGRGRSPGTSSATSAHQLAPSQKSEGESFDLGQDYRYEKLHQIVGEILHEERELDRCLYRNGIRPHWLIYEEIVSDLSYIATIIALLGIAPRETQSAQRQTRRLANQLNQKILEQFYADGGPQHGFYLLRSPQEYRHLLRKDFLNARHWLTAIAQWGKNGFHWPIVDFPSNAHSQSITSDPR